LSSEAMRQVQAGAVETEEVSKELELQQQLSEAVAKALAMETSLKAQVVAEQSAKVAALAELHQCSVMLVNSRHSLLQLQSEYAVLEASLSSSQKSFALEKAELHIKAEEFKANALLSFKDLYRSLADQAAIKYAVANQEKLDLQAKIDQLKREHLTEISFLSARLNKLQAQLEHERISHPASVNMEHATLSEQVPSKQFENTHSDFVDETGSRSLMEGASILLSSLRAFVGLVYETGYISTNNGVPLTSVCVGSAAHVAGIRSGHILCKINDVSLTSSEDLKYALRSVLPGDVVKCVILDGQHLKNVNLYITAYQAAFDFKVITDLRRMAAGAIVPGDALFLSNIQAKLCQTQLPLQPDIPIISESDVDSSLSKPKNHRNSPRSASLLESDVTGQEEYRVFSSVFTGSPHDTDSYCSLNGLASGEDDSLVSSYERFSGPMDLVVSSTRTRPNLTIQIPTSHVAIPIVSTDIPDATDQKKRAELRDFSRRTPEFIPSVSRSPRDV